jgi:hypothetical protein
MSKDGPPSGGIRFYPYNPRPVARVNADLRARKAIRQARGCIPNLGKTVSALTIKGLSEAQIIAELEALIAKQAHRRSLSSQYPK